MHKPRFSPHQASSPECHMLLIVYLVVNQMMHGCTFRPLWHARASLSSLSVSSRLETTPQFSPSNSTPKYCCLRYHYHCFCPLNSLFRSTTLMKFIVSVWTTMKISLMTSASYHGRVLSVSWATTTVSSLTCTSLCIYKAPARTVPPHTNRQLFQVRSLCKFAVMTSKALVALLAVVVACISESSSQDTLYQATGSCQVGLG